MHETVETTAFAGLQGAGLAAVHARIAHHFRRREALERARRYLEGLLGRIERKNGWQLAEALGEGAGGRRTARDAAALECSGLGRGDGA